MLIAGTLRSTMRPIFEPATMPADDPVRSWCTAYATYAQTAFAGTLLLAGPLTVVSSGGPFYDALDTSLRTMWMSARWIGPGLTGMTSIVPSVKPFLAAVAPSLLASYDRELAPTLIAEALHTYTLSIIVSVVPPVGSPFPVPLT